MRTMTLMNSATKKSKNFAIPCLEMAFNSFLYGYVQPNERGHAAKFCGGHEFNFINWDSIQSS